MADCHPPYAAMALAITSQDWTALGLEEDQDPAVAPSSDLEVTCERIVALLVIRLVAIHAPKGHYQDLSTTTLCRTALMAGHPQWPDPINETVLQELHKYVHKILSQYRNVPYHNVEHCYHVTISANKLLDLALNSEIQALSQTKPRMFGLRQDALMHFLLLFAALIHDVEHQGIPNRQLAIEDDDLAILYNDQSIAENRSLCVGFQELLQRDYTKLRQCLFVKGDDDYRRFRTMTSQLVLQTDLASPERTQIRKSKWKEAFGDDFQTMEAKVKHELKRRASSINVSPAAAATQGSAVSTILSELQQQQQQQPLPIEAGGGDDDSLTGTPEGSDAGDDNNDTNIATYDKTILQDKEVEEEDGTASDKIPGFLGTRKTNSRNNSLRDVRASMAALRQQGGGGGILMTEQQHQENETALEYSSSSTDHPNIQKFQKRVSQGAGHQRKFRLGIQRSIDLSGEFIETYSRRSSLSTTMAMQAMTLDQEEEEEEYDDLRASVIMEQILTTSDIAHVFQGWHQMKKFSNRLFLELKRAHKDGRGPHPRPNWYENQIAFLESYNLPLAHRLEDMGIFGPLVGPVFARLVVANRDQWIVDGQQVTDDIIAKGRELYPVEDD
jgi:3'5'-cyclic nucleotide phosphodiesterase